MHGCFAVDHIVDVAVNDFIKHVILVIKTALETEFARHSTPAHVHFLTAKNVFDRQSVTDQFQFENCKRDCPLLSVRECHSLLSSKQVSEIKSGREIRLQKIMLLLSASSLRLNNKSPWSRHVTARQYIFPEHDVVEGVDQIIGRHINGKSLDWFNQFSLAPRITKFAVGSTSSLYHVWMEPAQQLSSYIHSLIIDNSGCAAPSCKYAVREGSTGVSAQEGTIIPIKRERELQKRLDFRRVFLELTHISFTRPRPRFRGDFLAEFDPNASKEHNAAVLRVTLERFVFQNIGGRFVNGKATGPLMKRSVIITSS